MKSSSVALQALVFLQVFLMVPLWAKDVYLLQALAPLLGFLMVPLWANDVYLLQAHVFVLGFLKAPPGLVPLGFPDKHL